MSEENKKTALERLEVLENTSSNIIQAIQPLANMAQDLMNLREAVKLLNNKLDSVVKLLNAGMALSEENLNQMMTDNNAKELQDKVVNLVRDGLLVATNSVSKDSFVVINEQDASGKIVNPRRQFFVLELQNEEVRSKLEGAQVGSNIAVGDKGFSLNVLEAYNINMPQFPQSKVSPSESVPATSTASNDSTAPSASDSTVVTSETTASTATA